MSECSIQTDYTTVRPGDVKGLKQVARAYTDAAEFVTLTFVAALDMADEGDLVQVTGKPCLEVRLKGTNGDGTFAIVVNAISRALEAPPGLITMADLAIVTAC